MPRDFSRATLEMVATRFKVLSEPTRLSILNALREGEKSVSELVEHTETGQANVSKHLGILLRHRMVEKRKEGVNSFYRLADPGIFELCELVCTRLEEELETRRSELAPGEG